MMAIFANEFLQICNTYARIDTHTPSHTYARGDDCRLRANENAYGVSWATRLSAAATSSVVVIALRDVRARW